MKFTQFIKQHSDDITDEWVKFAQNNISGLNQMELEEVRDHIKEMLKRIVESMETTENDAEQEKKIQRQQGIIGWQKQGC